MQPEQKVSGAPVISTNVLILSSIEISTGDESSCFRLEDFFRVRVRHALPFRVLIPASFWRQTGFNGFQLGVICIGQPFFLPPPALMHCIYNLVPVLNRPRRIDEDRVWFIESVMSVVDDSAIPVLVPAVRMEDPRLPSAGWTLVLDRQANPRGLVSIDLPPCYAFVYRADKDSKGEVMGLDGFLSFPNVGMIKDNQQGIASDLRSAFDGMRLLSEKEVKDVLAFPRANNRSVTF